MQSSVSVGMNFAICVSLVTELQDLSPNSIAVVSLLELVIIINLIYSTWQREMNLSSYRLVQVILLPAIIISIIANW